MGYNFKSQIVGKTSAQIQQNKITTGTLFDLLS